MSRVPFSEPTGADEWVTTFAGRISCETCGEWVYTRKRRGSNEPFTFPPECQVCGAPLAAPPSPEQEQQ